MNIPAHEAQARIAREAYRDFGKGSGHPAGLNFSDCFAYTLAKARRPVTLHVGTCLYRCAPDISSP
jgi:ribonuclease VapC